MSTRPRLAIAAGTIATSMWEHGSSGGPVGAECAGDVSMVLPWHELLPSRHVVCLDGREPRSQVS